MPLHVSRYSLFLFILLFCSLPINGQVFFLNVPYSTNLNEESPIGTSVLSVQAEDFQLTSNTGTYALNSDEFEIDSMTGLVTIKSVIDREDPGTPLQFVSIISYTSDIGNSGNSTLTVSIQDINDNAPSFPSTLLSISLPEFTPTDTVIISINATDPDLVQRQQDISGEFLSTLNYTVDNGRVLYGIVLGEGSDYFDIDVDTGDIKVLNGSIDFDSTPRIVLNISASDGPGLTTYAILNIAIVDFNDNAPVILSPSSFTLTLAESVSINTVLIDNVTSIDLDHGSNAEIEYVLAQSNQSNRFSLHPITGKLSVSSSLDRDLDDTIQLTIIAIDNGQPRLSDNFTLTLILTDINDNIPKFSMDHFDIPVSEDTMVGSSVYTFSVSDPDEGLNGTIRFSLNHSHFEIDTKNGSLYLIQSLDRETRDGFNFTLFVFDLGEPRAHTSIASINISVQDVNDNSPTFNSSYFELHFLDTEGVGFVLSVITAMDDDIGTNAQISYGLTPSTNTPFSIDSDTGVITLTAVVRYSLQQEWYNYSLTAMDNAGLSLRRYDFANISIRVHEPDASAPVFSQLQYNATINESTPLYTVVLNVSALDSDRGLNGEVRYFVLGGNQAFCYENICGLAGTLDVDQISGVVFVNTSLDRDIRDNLQFQIITYDGGYPVPKNDTTNITIYLLDSPDTPPQFPSSSVNTSVHENLPALTYITTITATDPDTGDAGVFFFSIDRTVLDGEYFIVNATSGELFSNFTFDREFKSLFQIEVTAKDSANIPLSSTLIVNISILDTNDNAPYASLGFVNRILEAKPINTIVDSNLTFQDDDIGVNAEISYYIFSSTPESHFMIEKNTGIIFSNLTLNISLIPSYNVCIFARDNAFPFFNVTFCVEIQVLDGNFNSPLFSQSKYNIIIPESTRVNTNILNLNATDGDFSDNNNLVHYSIGKSEPNFYINTFSVDILKGELELISIVDRENISQINLTILAIDQPNFDLARTSSIIVSIRIEDINEFRPYFPLENDSITISEGVGIDSLVYTLSAVDLDADYPNNAISYSVQNTTYSQSFRVDSTTGDVFTSSLLDREEIESFLLVFTAVDQGLPSLNSSFTLNITLSDINDNPPYLLNTVLYTEENQIAPFTVSFLKFSDNDIGPNATLFEFRLSNNTQNFTLNNTTGELSSLIPFDRESIDTYSLTVILIDSGSPPLSSETNITIIVTDTNDNSPQFERSLYETFFSEDNTLDTSVITVTATDEDIGQNAVLTYSIVTNSSYFQIDSINGTVFNVRMFDYEDTNNFTLILMVSDGNFKVEVTLDVYIIDINDNAPLFVENYNFSIRECLSAHTHLGTVITTDRDGQFNNTYTEYSLVPSRDDQFFSIHFETGVLKTLVPLDRELQSSFLLTVIANNTLARIPNANFLNILISVVDINDNRPTFQEQTRTIEINDSTAIGTVLHTFRAIDFDLDSVTYTLLAGNVNDTFYINASTGDLVLRKNFDFFTQPFFSLSVSASDRVTNTTSILNVEIKTDYHYSIRFPNSQYQISLPSNFSDLNPFFELTLLASDHPLSSNFSYIITNGNEANVFALSNSGSISVLNHSSLQHNLNQSYNLSIHASSSIGLSSSSMITIFVSDASNSQSYSDPVYYIKLPENSTANNFIASFPNAFSINSGNEGGNFVVNSSNTLLTANVPDFDYEKRSIYALNLFFSSPVNTYSVVVIELVDINEHIPQFASDNYYLTFQDYSEYQNGLFPILAFDRDVHSDNFILDFEDKDSLSVSIQSNMIRFDDPVIADYPFTRKRLNISLKIDNNIVDFANVVVTFLPINRFAPVFNRTAFAYSVRESNSLFGTRLDVITATDSDAGTNGLLSYGLAGNHKDRDFIVDSNSGLITINFPLDYEYQIDYTLQLFAYDNGYPCLSASTRVTITVLNTNDNTPIFVQDLYTITLFENVSVNTELLTVLATDADPIIRVNSNILDGSGLVSYSLSPNISEIQISAFSGIVTTSQSLDRESFAGYDLTIIAIDGGGLTDESRLIVTLLDINDNAPMFENETLYAELQEHSPNVTRIGLFLATDPDEGPNAEITYEIISGNPDNYFYLDFEALILYANHSFDRESVDRVVLTLLARDNGAPQLSSEAYLEIEILDINDHSPVFSQPFYSSAVSESISVGSQILQVNASDQDSGTNSELVFSILNGNSDSKFILNNVTGVTTLAEMLDFESVRNYTLFIQVLDSNAFPRVDNATVIIYVTDANDNRPVFSQNNYTVSIPESIGPNSFILQVVAFDVDRGVNSNISFSLDFSVDPSAQSLFYIEKNSGKIFVGSSNFNFEAIPQFRFQVIATDLGSSPLTTMVDVFVLIINENDNLPIFSQPIYSFDIQENMIAPTHLITFNATDLDGDDIFYSLDTFSNQTLCTQLCSLNFNCQNFTLDLANFYVVSSTGELYANISFDREFRENYAFFITASDRENITQSLTTRVCVVVRITDSNDNTPIPVQNQYNVVLAENTEIPHQILTLEASDADSGPNAELTWRIISVSPSYPGFQIHPTLGVLILSDLLDRENTAEYSLAISVSDNGTLALSAGVTVDIRISDVNDNSPIFTNNNFTVQVSENAPLGFVIIQLTATDMDFGENASISYSLTPTTFFNINISTGEVYVMSHIDFESLRSHVLTIQAEDDGNPSQQGNATLKITVLDSNDHSPVFSSNIYTVNLTENVLYDQSILQVQTTDADTLEENTQISFEILQVSPTNPGFTISPSSGELWLYSVSFDAEFNTEYTIILQANNSNASVSLAANTTIIILISDLNDNPPSFSSPIFFGTVNEASPIGYSILQVTASDNDVLVQNSAFSFKLDTSTNASFFAIDNSTGELTLRNQIDFENTDQLSFSVIAINSLVTTGNPMLSSTSQISVSVTDSNDNPAFFTQVFNFEFPENSIGILGAITATDPDNQTDLIFSVDSAFVSVNGTITQINHSIFSIHPNTGELSLIQVLDRETAFDYIVEVSVSDGQHITSTNVSIQITDQNDNTPQTLFSQYTFQIYENNNISDVVFTPVVIDLDIGMNSQLRFKFSSSFPSDGFSIAMLNTGVVLLEFVLDRETQDLYTLEVEISDLGIVSLTSTTRIIIQVLDLNDNVPVFSDPFYSFSITEDSQVFREINTFTATDQDIGLNSQFEFFSNTSSFPFEILTNGTLILSNPIDFENTSSYIFAVYVRDFGTPSFTSSAQVTITVLDINDNNPIFQELPLTVSISEHTTIYTAIFTLKAFDADSIQNKDYFFSIQKGNSDQKFSINENTGDISTIDTFDFEIANIYRLTVIVTDRGLPPLSSSAELEINIVDENDNAPTFSQPEYQTSIREDLSINSSIFQIESSDMDSGTNSQIEYTILPQSSTGFAINSSTGVVYVADALNFEQTRLYSLLIQASDKGIPTQSSLTYLHIQGTDVNEHAPIFPITYNTIYLPNTLLIGTEVLQLSAYDLDLYGPPITYEFLANSLDQMVDLNTQTGRVYLENSLNGLIGNYSLIIQASDGMQNSQLFLNLILHQIDTYTLSFSFPSFFFSIPDNSAVGDELALVTGVNVTRFDLDLSSGNLEFSEVFSLTDDGRVFLAAPVDSMIQPVYSSDIFAINSGDTIQSVITIRVSDAQNDAPQFSSPSYQVELSEVLPVSSTFLTVSAWDPDPSDQGLPLSYTISGGNELSIFSVNTQTGQLSISRSLDREIVPRFNLTIQAIGNGIGTAEVIIYVTDVNDNVPKFSEDVYRLSLPSDTPVDSSILQVVAYDGDTGRNGELTYSILSQTISGLFVLNSMTGELVLNSSLSMHAIQSYTFYVSSTDNGLPLPLNSEVQVYINIVQPNLFAPVFSTLTNNITILETARLSTFIFQFAATDSDTNTSTGIYYTLSSSQSLPFSLTTNGELFLTSPLDYLQAIRYDLVITASDTGIPTRYSSINFVIFIEDTNNHIPSFSQPSYQISLGENFQTNIPFLTTTASDLDATSLTYIISLNSLTNEGDNIFAINPDTSEISLRLALDFETSTEHQLLITVRDHGYPISQFNSVTVTINVLDVNDNPPIFSQTDYNVVVPRLYTSGRAVTSVSAQDVDSSDIFFSINFGDSENIFVIDRITGDVSLNSDITNSVASVYNLGLQASDGVLNSASLLSISISNNASYCYDGVCTEVIPSVVCTIPQCTECPIHFTLSTSRSYCFNFTCLSSNQYMCELSNSRECRPYSSLCNGNCTADYSKCPSDNLCYSNSLSSQTCDSQNEVCLDGYVLVQYSDNTRNCLHPSALPTQTGRICTTLGKVYCSDLVACHDLSDPNHCQPCLPSEHECPDTMACVSEAKMCCGVSGYFCNITDSCIPSSEPCFLDRNNTAPILPSSAELISDSNTVVGLVLGNGNLVGVDAQMEELGIAIIGHFPTDMTLGQWQYVGCRDAPSDPYGHCSIIEGSWLYLPLNTSIDNAFVLSPNHRVRFVPTNSGFEGSAWLRVHLWDGSIGGVLSDSSSAVRGYDPFFIFLPPFIASSSFSQEFMYFVYIVNPITSFPAFVQHNAVSFPDKPEDYSSLDNTGVLLNQHLGGIHIPNLSLLSSSTILGLPTADASIIQTALPPSALTSYFSAVASTNLFRSRRSAASAGYLLSNANDNFGQWQVSITGKQSDWYPIASILGDTHTLLFIPQTSRIRYIPNSHTHGMTSITLYPWDGTTQHFAIQTTSIRDVSYLRDVALPTQVGFSLGSVRTLTLRVNSIKDAPIVTNSNYRLPTIPYFIQYHREDVFVLELELDVEAFKIDILTFADYLALTFYSRTSILFYEPLTDLRTSVSFRIEERLLTLNEISTSLDLRKDVLLNFGFNITKVSQDTFVGHGYGCFDSSLYGPNAGQSAGLIAISNGIDNDNDILGLAVTRLNGTEFGIWQYYRNDQSSADFNPLLVNWVTLPTTVSESNAFILRSTDRLRFTPYPRAYWRPTLTPALLVRLWDNSAGSIAGENDYYHANTDPFSSTTHSMLNPIGLFSFGFITLTAHRQDCSGAPDTAIVFDACCVCGGAGMSCVGCNGNSNDTQHDSCLVCGGDDSTCVGCDLVPFANAQTFNETVCRSNSSTLSAGQIITYFDCQGTAFGPSILDDCNVCTGGTTNNLYNSQKDCNGQCDGTASLNQCGICIGGDTGRLMSQEVDCRGICDGNYSTGSCGVCQHDSTQINYRDCAGECFGSAQIDNCSTCYGGTAPIATADSALDGCGVCGGNGLSCVGCDGTVGKRMDNCGDCGGENCECFEVTRITPNAFLAGASTTITVEGGGFFFNPDSSTPTKFPNGSYHPLCGGIRQLPNSIDFIQFYCIFGISVDQTDLVKNLRGVYVDQSTILCDAPTDVFLSDNNELSLRIQFEDTTMITPENSLTLHLVDNNVRNLSVLSASLNSNLVGQETEVYFDLENFDSFDYLSCIIHGFSQCSQTYSDFYVISAVFIHSGKLMCFIPPAQNPCQITISISINGKMAGIIPTENFPFSFFYPQPVVVESRVQGNLASIIVQFENAIFLTEAISLGCPALFDSDTINELGTSQCTFISGNSRLLITLSTDATIKHNSLLRWKPNSIFAVSQTNSYPLSTPTRLQLPSPLHTPVPIILGPNTIPNGGNVSFSAQFSYPTGYKPFQFFWDILPSSVEFDFVSASRKLTQLPVTAEELVLDSNDFMVGVEYKIILCVINSFGIKSESTEKVITKNNFPTYAITLISNPITNFVSTQQILFSVQIHYPAGSGEVEITFEWNIEQLLPSNAMVSLSLSGLVNNSSSILIPPNYLTPEFAYIISIKVNFDSSSLTRQEFIFVNSPAPIAIIEGGNREVGRNQMLLLDAKSSVLMDLNPGISQQIVWECFEFGTLIPCKDSSQGITSVLDFSSSSLTQEFESNQLATGSYLFQLTLSSLSTHSVRISVVNTDVLSLYVTPFVYELPGDGVLVLSSHVRGAVDLINVFWQCEQIEGQGYLSLQSLSTQHSYQLSTEPTPQLKTAQIHIFPTQWNELNLFIPTSLINPYLNYTFSINTMTSQNNFKSSITLYSNVPPRSGQLILSQISGLPLSDEVTLTAKDFLDPLHTLKYEFTYTIDGSGEVPIHPRSILSAIIFIPPLVDASAAKTATLSVSVFNSLDKSIKISKSFTINTSNGNNVADFASLLTATQKFVQNKELDKVGPRLSTLIFSLQHNPLFATPETMGIIFTMINELYFLPQTQYAYSFYLDLLAEFSINQIPSQYLDQFLQLLLRISTDISYSLSSIKISSTHSFPKPLIIPHDYRTVVKIRDILQNLPNNFTTDPIAIYSILNQMSNILCQSSFFASNSISISSSKLEFYFSSGYLYPYTYQCKTDQCRTISIAFPANLARMYFDWDCNPNSLYRCNGLCSTFHFVQMEPLTGLSLVEITGNSKMEIAPLINSYYFSFQELNLLSEIVVLHLKHPISTADITLSNDQILIDFTLIPNQAISRSIYLCLYRNMMSSEWNVESYTIHDLIPSNITCGYTHFTQYALGRLPLSPITTQSTVAATTTPLNTTTIIIITATTISAYVASMGIPIAPIGATIAILIVFIVAVVTIVLIILFCVWKRKKTKSRRLITPTPSDDQISEGSAKTTDGLFFNISVITNSGLQDNIGKIQLAPSSRLREIRGYLLDSFPEHFEKKAFYFLTKRRELIDPSTENNHFLRIVYDNELIIKYCNPKDDAFRTVFCCCGKIAFFECSRCHGQAYCSAECQVADWDEHKSECLLLTERKKRQTVLKNIQSNLQRSDHLRQRKDSEISLTPQKYDTWSAFLQQQGGKYDSTRPIAGSPIRSQPHLSQDGPSSAPRTDRVRQPLVKVHPLPPILSTIQKPLTKPDT